MSSLTYIFIFLVILFLINLFGYVTAKNRYDSEKFSLRSAIYFFLSLGVLVLKLFIYMNVS